MIYPLRVIQGVFSSFDKLVNNFWFVTAYQLAVWILLDIFRYQINTRLFYTMSEFRVYAHLLIFPSIIALFIGQRTGGWSVGKKNKLRMYNEDDDYRPFITREEAAIWGEILQADYCCGLWVVPTLRVYGHKRQLLFIKEPYRLLLTFDLSLCWEEDSLPCKARFCIAGKIVDQGVGDWMGDEFFQRWTNYLDYYFQTAA
jgi:hypothetical protein